MDVDCLIIGAGMAGISTAYWLSKEDPSLRGDFKRVRKLPVPMPLAAQA